MPLRRIWPAAIAALVLVFFAQELLEGALASGHPAGLGGVLGVDGWSAIALAVPVGLLVALGLRGDDALAAAVARRIGARPLTALPVFLTSPARGHSPRPGTRLLPARGPPFLSLV